MEKRRKRALITGGAGFIGTNMAHELLRRGIRVRILDNLSRAGVEENARWLSQGNNGDVELLQADVRDAKALRRAVAGADFVFHFAAQAAVTTSLLDPLLDFEVNLRGTLNLLEALRAQPDPPPLLFTSTNKIYGSLVDLELALQGSRWQPVNRKILRYGVDETRSLDFHSPYGCSKGAADQYVLDYARIYALPTIVFRMSCIYGPHQFGTEDQGWVAHFLLQALSGRTITLYGDGRQVRDILFVEDLVRAMLAAVARLEATRGRAFNIGGGPANTTSLLELLTLIERLQGGAPRVELGSWRQGDQRYYVSDIRRFSRLTGWAPQVGLQEGVRRLYDWLKKQQSGPAARTGIAAPRTMGGQARLRPRPAPSPEEAGGRRPVKRRIPA